MQNSMPVTGDRSPLLVIVNSRRLKSHRQQLDEFVRRLYGHPLETRLTEYAGHAVELARNEAARFPIIAAAGGDGTVSDVANGILASGSQAALLAVPLGTGNDFARELDIRGVEDAVRVWRNGATREVDVIEIVCQREDCRETRYSVLTAGVAFGADVIRHTSDRVKRIFGSRGAYSVGLFLALATYSPPRLRIRGEAESFDARMFFVSVGNAEWSGGGTMCLSPGAKIDDGQFDVCVFDTRSKLRVLTSFLHILRGTHLRLPEVTYFPARELDVQSEPPSELMIDGEALGQTPAHFRIRPRALRVLCHPSPDPCRGDHRQ